jgi:hypothetical protein
MSYDYDALVQEFWSARRRAAGVTSVDEKRTHLVAAIQAAETLSGHCPMTPRLWIQYASTLGELVGSGSTNSDASGSSENSIEYMTLQLGLVEFPGSLLLHLRAAHVAPAVERQECYERAVEAVGRVVTATRINSSCTCTVAWWSRVVVW